MVNKLVVTIEKLKKLRSLLDTLLYPNHSVVTYDLILDILQAFYMGKELTIKDLSTGSVRSALNVRQHPDQLEKDGWIIFSNGVHDKRLRFIKATPKLTLLCSKIFNEL